MLWIICPLIFLAGFVDAIAGGGGLISLPAYMAVGLPAHIALGTNKCSSFIGSGIAAVRFAKGGYIHWRSALFSFAGALAGSACGARLALLLSERTLKLIVLVLIPAVAAFLILKKDFGTARKAVDGVRTGIYSVLTGLFVGAYDGFFGPGTGTFLIIAFTAILGFELVTACGNAKVVNFASNLAAVITFVLHGSVNYKIGIPCAVFGILGNYLGSGLAIRKGTKIVRPVMFTVIGMLMLKVISDLFL